MSHHLRKNLSAGLFALLFSSAALTAAGAKGVVLASSDLPATGTEITWKESAAMKGMTLKLNANGQDMDGTMNQQQDQTTTTTILAADKVKLVATEKKMTGKVEIAGQEQPSPDTEFVLKDVPVLLERKDGQWAFTLENGSALSDDQRKELLDQDAVRSFTEGLGIYGTGEREAGQKWDVEASKLPSFIGLDKPAGTVSAEFVKVETVSGTECATIKLTFDITGATSDALKVHVVGESTIHRSIADRIDLDSKLTGKVDITASPQEGLTMTLTGPIQTDRTITVKKP